MAPKQIRSHQGRPSRLLNLNKSPTKNKKITATNAALSPFLRLPPEVRGRIYDYALGGNIVHVSYHTHRKGYKLDICCVEDSVPLQRIVHLPPPKVYKKHYSFYTQHDDCTSHNMRKPLTRRDMPLSLLRVCRQIYHEAALRPFSQTIFIIQEMWHWSSRAFLLALVPSQARAIKHIRFVCVDGQCPLYKVMQHVKSLESLTFQLVEAFEDEEPYRFDIMFEHLGKNLTTMKDFDVRSFHISMFVDDTFTTAEKELVAARLERVETSSRQILA